MICWYLSGEDGGHDMIMIVVNDST